MNLAGAFQIYGGGPGSGCHGDKCGRPKGSGEERNDKTDYMAKKTGGAKGSNAGGFYTGSDGVQRYVKFYKHSEQAWGEHLANSIYTDLGLGAPKSEVFQSQGKTAFASEIIDDNKGTLQDIKPNKELANKVLDGFAADVLTANWDAVGLWLDNILVGKEDVYRIDNGAAFWRRAQGDPKPTGLLNKITEWDGFFNPSINKEYSRLAGIAGYHSADQMGAKVKDQIEHIKEVRDAFGGWEKYIEKRAPDMPADLKRSAAEILENRTKLLLQKANSL